MQKLTYWFRFRFLLIFLCVLYPFSLIGKEYLNLNLNRTRSVWTHHKLCVNKSLLFNSERTLSVRFTCSLVSCSSILSSAFFFFSTLDLDVTDLFALNSTLAFFRSFFAFFTAAILSSIYRRYSVKVTVKFPGRQGQNTRIFVLLPPTNEVWGKVMLYSVREGSSV